MCSMFQHHPIHQSTLPAHLHGKQILRLYFSKSFMPYMYLRYTHKLFLDETVKILKKKYLEREMWAEEVDETDRLLIIIIKGHVIGV